MARWWQYQRERFPLFANGMLIAALCACTLLISSQSTNTPPPDPLAFVAAIASTLLVFFQLRVADEHKDFEIDARYRSHRAVPRGLVSLRELRTGALVGAGVQLLIAWHFGVVAQLCVLWTWLALMTHEFFAADWLRRHPVVYLLSHMLIMPLIVVHIASFARPGAVMSGSAGVPAELLALVFLCGLILETGRKIRAPVNERLGVETYSALWGLNAALALWLICIAAAVAAFAVLLPLVGGDHLELTAVTALAATAAAACVPLICARYRNRRKADAAMEPASGLLTLTLLLALGPIQTLLR